MHSTWWRWGIFARIHFLGFQNIKVLQSMLLSICPQLLPHRTAAMFYDCQRKGDKRYILKHCTIKILICWCGKEKTGCDQVALCAVTNKIEIDGDFLSTFLHPTVVFFFQAGCSPLADLYNLVESSPACLRIIQSLSTHSLHHYQISIESAWHFLTHHLFHASLCFANDA